MVLAKAGARLTGVASDQSPKMQRREAASDDEVSGKAEDVGNSQETVCDIFARNIVHFLLFCLNV